MILVKTFKLVQILRVPFMNCWDEEMRGRSTDNFDTCGLFY